MGLKNFGERNSWGLNLGLGLDTKNWAEPGKEFQIRPSWAKGLLERVKRGKPSNSIGIKEVPNGREELTKKSWLQKGK